MASISCKNCGEQMEVTTRPKHNHGLGFFLMILGTISIFVILPFGVLLVGTGLYFCCVKESIWLCGSCKTAIPRVEI